MLVSIVILFVLILVSGVLSSSEIALSSSNRNKVKMLVDKGNKKAAGLLDTIDKPNRFFATTQLYITFIAFFSGAYAANSFTDPIMGWVSRSGLPVPEYIAEPVVFFLITAVLTYFSLIFGELVPKRIAMQYAIPFSLKTLPFLKALSTLALPVVKLLSASARLVLKLLGVKDTKPETDVTKEEICMMVESGTEHGHIDENEQGMIENIFKINQLTAGDICTHRLKLAALPLDADYKTVIEILTEKYFSRVPVYEENLDNVRGFLHTKDVLNYVASSPDTSKFDIKTLMREAHFVPLSKKADELFQEMRKERTHMAVVLDEYGGTLGIVTMEDLMEKIVGSIQDEYDSDELPDIAPAGEHAFKIQGTTALEAVQNHFDIPLPVDEYDTLSGFLVGQLGYIPSEGEKPEVSFGGLDFKVESLHEKRVATVMVRKTPEGEAGE
ncbi:MAG: hemolysin family protein [Treponema sp.]|nr:hemolysin family protein [Treponema sp.]